MIAQILSYHRHTLADLSFQAGIDIDKVFSRLHHETHGNAISGNIAIDKKADEGNPYVHVNEPFYHAASGKKYPCIVFGTNAHGGEKFVFNGWNESKNDADTDYIPTFIAPRVKSAAEIQKETNQLAYKETTLKQAATAFESANCSNVSAHAYIVSKSVNVDGADIRIVSGNRLQYAIHNIEGAVIGYQTIDSTGDKKYVGSIGGGMTILGGSIADCERGFIGCEGLSTGLSAYHDAILNPTKLPVVVCLDAGNMIKVVDAFVDRFDNASSIQLLADNDTGDSKKGNTGVCTVLKICKKHGIKSYFLPFDASDLRRKVDFNDVQTFEVVDVPASTDLKLELLKVVADKSAQKLFDDIAKDVIFNTRAADKKGIVAAGYHSLNQCVDIINNALTLREGLKFDAINKVSIAIANQFAYRSNYLVNDDDIANIITQTIVEFDNAGIECDVIAAQKFIENNVSKAREVERKLKTITDMAAFDDVMNVDDLTPVEVAFNIEFESLYQSTLFVDNRGMNGYKTQTLVELAPALKGGIAYISPLVSVCKQAADRMGFYDYHSMSPRFVESHTRNINAVFCINSIPKFNLDQHFTHGFIDELAAVYESIHDDHGTNKHQQKLITECLRKFLSQCETIVISDAGMNSNHVKWVKSLCGDKKVVLLSATPPQSTVNHYLLQNHAHAHEFILRDVAAGKRGVIGCDTVANAIAVKKILSGVAAQLARVNITRVLLATGENSGELDVNDFIEQPNENDYRYDVVIHSPIIRSGTSINTTEYEFAYLLYDGVISTSDAMQIWGRCRNAQNRYVSFGKRIDKTRVTDFNLLFEIERDEQEQKGNSIVRTDLNMRRHSFTAQINADKNNFKNNFLFHCEISGREIIRLESEIKNDKKLTIEVKEKRCTDRLNANLLTADEYKQIKSANKRLQSETDAMKRHEVVLMAHGNNATADSEISHDDCMNEINNMLKPLLVFESLTAEIASLKALDKIDKDNDCLKFSRVRLQKALLEFLEPLHAAKGRIGKSDFNKACDKLEKHRVILAASGLGKFTKINRNRSGFTVSCLLEKLGYEIAETTAYLGESFYEINPHYEIARYATQRKAFA